MIESFNQKPNNYKKNIDQIVTLISSDSDHTSEAVKMLHDLVSETEKILK